MVTEVIYESACRSYTPFMGNDNPRRFSWLHLSGLLCSPQQPAATIPWEALKSDLEGLTNSYGPCDALFITGDLARTGKDSEYLEVTRLLQEHLLPLIPTDGPIPLLFVPGNHDVNQRIARNTIAAKVFTFWSEDPELRRNFWRQNRPYKKVIDEAFRGYSNWFLDSVRAGKREVNFGVMPGDFSTSITLNTLKVGIVGLNTAFTALAPKGRPAISTKQLDAVCGEDAERWINRHDLNILLTHHPPNWLDQESQRAFRGYIAPPGRFAFHLCENQHIPNEFIREESATLLIQSPSFFQSTPKRFGYVWGSLQIRSGLAELTIRPRQYEVRRKAYSSAQHDPRIADHYQKLIQLNTSTRRSKQKSKTKAFPLSVQRIELNNFRNFERFSIEFDPQSSLGGRWTCLAGINGAGKSSILQALSVILLGEPFVLELGGDRLDRLRRRVKGVKQEARISAWINDQGTDNYVELNLGEQFEKSRNFGDSYYSVMLDFWKKMRSRVVLSYGVTRNLSDFRETRHLSLSPDVRRVMTLFDPLTRIESAEVLLNQRLSVSSPIWKLLDSLLKQIFSESFGVRNQRGKVTFTFEDEPVDAIDLPDGFRSSVAWLVDLCSAWTEKHQPNKKVKLSDIEAIVLIDEIDLHLHPSLQRVLVPRLRKALPLVQWIVTTHSPLILSSFETSEIVALDRTEPGGIRFLDRQILGFSTDQIYDWLMDTPPTSIVMDQKLAQKEASPTTVNSQGIAELLEMSPEVNAREAEKRVIRRRQRLDAIKSEE